MHEAKLPKGWLLIDCNKAAERVKQFTFYRSKEFYELRDKLIASLPGKKT